MLEVIRPDEQLDETAQKIYQSAIDHIANTREQEIAEHLKQEPTVILIPPENNRWLHAIVFFGYSEATSLKTREYFDRAEMDFTPPPDETDVEFHRIEISNQPPLARTLGSDVLYAPSTRKTNILGHLLSSTIRGNIETEFEFDNDLLAASAAQIKSATPSQEFPITKSILIDFSSTISKKLQDQGFIDQWLDRFILVQGLEGVNPSQP